MIELSALLNQSKSRKQINSDIKTLEQSLNALKLTATFAKADTKRELNAYIKQMDGQLATVKLRAKMDQAQLKRDINNSLKNIQLGDINIKEHGVGLKLRKIYTDFKKQTEKTPVAIDFTTKKQTLQNQLTTFLSKNSKIRESSVLLKEADKLRDMFDNIDSKDSLKSATEHLRLFRSECTATGYTSKSTTEKIGDMVKGVVKIGSAFGVANVAVQNFQKSLQTLKNNDTILTEINKTSEMNKKQLTELGDSSFATASKYGQLSSNYLLGVQEMARSGYEDTSKELGELSLLAQSAGDMTAEMANNYLLATDAAFKYSGSIEKLNAALDGANYISNKNSASLTDIADAIRVSASFAANAGIGIDELTAAESTMVAATKRSGSEMGRTFRSIILNLQGVSGEFDGEVIDEEQLEKVEKRCHSLGVELEYMKDGMATLRNPMEVLKDLAEVYNSLPDNSADKQGLIKDLGGKYNANGLSALLSRWDLYEKMLSEYSQGAGSSLIEAEKTANSWEGKLNSLSNSWDSFVNTLTNKEAVVGGISIFDHLIQGAEKLTDVLGALPVILTTITGSVTALNKDYGITQVYNKDKKKFDIQGNFAGIDFTAIKAQKKHFADAENAIAKWNGELISGQYDINDFNELVVKNNAQLKEYLSTCSKDAPASLEGYKSFLHAAGENTDALRLKTVLLNSALTLVTSIGIQGAITLISKMITSHQEMVETLNSTAQSFNKENQSIEENKAKIIELKTALDSGNLSYSDAASKRDDLLTIQSSLIESYGSEAEGIDLVNGSLETQLDLLDKVNNKKLQEAINKANDYTTGQKITNVFENFSQYLRNIFDGNFSEEAWTWDDNALGTNLDNATAEMEGFSAKFKALDNENLNKIIESFKEISRLGDTFYIRGNAEDVKNTVMELQEQLGSSTEYTDELGSQLTNIYNKTDDILSDYKEGYNLAKMQEIAKDEKLSDYYNDITDAYNTYKNAVTSGDEELTAQTLQNYSDLLETMSNDESIGNSMFRYFTEMYPELKSEVEGWKFDTKITPELDVEDSSINSDIKQLSTFTIEDLSRKYTDIINGTSGGLSDVQRNALLDIHRLADECDMQLDEFLEKLSEAGRLQSRIKETEISQTPTIDLSNVTSQITSLTSAQESLNTAISEQNENGTISSETLAKLQENYENVSDAIEITANGIILNKDKLAQLNKTQKEAIESGLADSEEELTKRFNENSAELAYYNGLLENNNGITEYNGQNLQELIAAKQADQEATEGQIAELQSLQLEYENAMSKHNAFIQSLSSKDAGSMYDDIVSALDTVQKEWDKGNYGKDEIRNFVDYMSYDDMSTASIEEIKNAYQSAMDEANKYYTETTKGQQNFLNLLKETKVNGKALASVDKENNWTISIDDMEEAAQACGKSVDFLQDNLNKLKDKGFEIEFETDNDNLVDVQANLDAINNRIAEIKAQLNSGDGSPKLKEELAELENSKVEIEVAVNQQKAIEEIQSLQARMADATPDVQAQLKQKQTEIASTYNIDLQSVLKVDTETANSEVDGLTKKVEDLKLSTTIKVDANTSHAKLAIDSVTNKTYTAKIALEVNGTKFSSRVKSIIENAANKTGGTDNSSNGAGAYGTVNIKGNAHADGTIGTNKKQKNVMVSEVKPEMVVDPRKGDYTIYQHPTMLKELPQNAIVFNGDQTEEILKNGTTTSFGKAYVNGNASGKAYKTGSTGSGNLNTPNNSKKTSKSSSKSKSKDKDKKSSKTQIDWIARKLEQLQKKIDLTKAKFENLFNIDKKSSNLDTQIKQTTKLMNAESKAADKYKKKAESYAKSSKLSKSLQKAVREGRLDKYSLKDLIKKYGEKTANKIQEYQKWYDNYQEAQKQAIELETEIRNLKEEQYQLYVDEADANIDKLNAKKDIAIGYKDQNKYLDQQKAYLKQSYDYQIKIAELTKDEIKKAQLQAEYEKALRDLENEKFENIKKYYESQIDLIDASENAIKDQVDLLEAKGMSLTAKYYDDQIAYEKQKQAQLQKSKAELETQLKYIVKGTDEWYDAKSAISEVNSELVDCNKSIAEMNSSITTIADNFMDKMIGVGNTIMDTMDWAVSLMDNVDTFNSETGMMTKEGFATLGSYVSGYNTSGAMSEMYRKLTANLESNYNKKNLSFTDTNGIKRTYNSLEEFKAAIDDTYEEWRDQISKTYDYESKIVDMMRKKLENELSALKNLIEAKQKALDAEKDLFNYQKSIKESTQNVTSLEKQIAALQGDTSEETSMRIQKLQKELSDKREDLQEKEYDRYISDQQDMLDKLYDEYESFINSEMQDVKKLLADGISIAQSVAGNIEKTVNDYVAPYDYNGRFDSLDTAIGNITNNSDSSIANIIKNTANEGVENTTQKQNNSTGVVTVNGESHGTGYKKIEPQPLKTPVLNTMPNTPSKTETIGFKVDSKSALSDAKSYVKKHVVKASKKKSEYSDVNKAIYDNKAKAYSGTGKVLTADGLKGLAKELGIKYNNSKKTGNLYTTLKKIKFPGFKKGGIAKLIKSQGEDGITLARNGEGFIAPEHVKPIEELVESVPQVNNVIKTLDGVELIPVQPDWFKNISTDIVADMFKNTTPVLTDMVKPKFPDIQPVSNMNSVSVNIDNITLPNVTDPKEFTKQLGQTIQNDNNIQKLIRTTSVDRAMGGARLAKNKIHF